MSNSKHSVKVEKRACILKAAGQVFARKGYETTVLEEVAREAGLAKGTLYLYFKDKEALYLQTVLHALESLERYVMEQVAGQPLAVEKLRVFACSLLDFFVRNQETLRLFAALFTPGVADLHRKLIRPLLEKRTRLVMNVSALVDEGKRLGAIRRDLESQRIALSFLGMIDQAIQSLGYLGLKEPPAEVSPEFTEHTVDTIMCILLEGISSTSEGRRSR
jgi:AcrR family transcriptional regulator